MENKIEEIKIKYSDLPEEKKKDLIDMALVEAGRILMAMFYALDLKTHISGDIINDTDGKTFKLSFTTSEFGLVKKEQADKLADALRELIQVKDWKDKHGKDEHYCKAQPIAWDIAKQTLTEYENQVNNPNRNNN